MKCPKCGNIITIQQFSCSQCGLRLPVKTMEERLRAEKIAERLYIESANKSSGENKEGVSSQRVEQPNKTNTAQQGQSPLSENVMQQPEPHHNRTSPISQPVEIQQAKPQSVNLQQAFVQKKHSSQILADAPMQEEGPSQKGYYTATKEEKGGFAAKFASIAPFLMVQPVPGILVAVFALILIAISGISGNRTSASADSGTEGSVILTTAEAMNAGEGASSSDENEKEVLYTATEETEKQQGEVTEINGFDADTNQSVSLAGFTFSIPSYFAELKTENASENVRTFAYEGENALSVLYFDYSEVDTTESVFAEKKEQIVNAFVKKAEGSLIDYADAYMAGLPGIGFTYHCKINRHDATAMEFVVFHPENKTVLRVGLRQADLATQSCLEDFEKIIQTAVVDEPVRANTDDAQSATAASEEQQESSSAGEVTPSFKQAMDRYEKTIDQYVAFMKKDNPDMAEYMNLMMEYANTMEALDNIDEDSLSEADALYYTKVMLRISEKLSAAY